MASDPYSPLRIALGYVPGACFWVAALLAVFDGANYAAAALLGVSGLYIVYWMDKTETKVNVA